MASATLGTNGHGPATAVADFPAPPDPAVYHGLAGEVVQTLAPHTEADPVALLVSLLAAVGNVVGSGPHYVIDGRPHTARVFPVLVGATSSGRKGTSWGAIAAILGAAFPAWLAARVKSGLVSGEGLIWHVRDPIVSRETIKVKGEIRTQDVETDGGVPDKRLFVLEEEFAAVLKAMSRENNTLSTAIRQAWDGGRLATLAKHHSVTASDTHVTVLGHITPDELTRYLDSVEAANGFGNRFLWLCVRRSRLLPEGGGLDEGTLVGLAQMLERTVEDARALGRLRLDPAARAMWHRVYGRLSDSGGGFVGELLARGAPQVLRLAMVYALLDVSPHITGPHLDAALELWEYAAASVRRLFAGAVGDPAGDTILAALAHGPMTQSEISALFGRNLAAPQLARTLGSLLAAGLVRCGDAEPDGGRGRGRPAKVWSLV